MERDPWFSARRDRLACWLCNAILNTLATPHYRAMIGGSVRYGLNAAARDQRTNTPPPRFYGDYDPAGITGLLVSEAENSQEAPDA